MLAEKLKFADEVVNIVREVCTTAFNAHSDEDLLHIFGLNHEQMEEVVGRIIDGLPDSIFTQDNAKLLDEIKYICAREFIFFQVQEKWGEPEFEEDLKRFTQIFSRDIQSRINSRQKFQVAMKEGK